MDIIRGFRRSDPIRSGADPIRSPIRSGLQPEGFPDTVRQNASAWVPKGSSEMVRQNASVWVPKGSPEMVRQNASVWVLKGSPEMVRQNASVRGSHQDWGRMPLNSLPAWCLDADPIRSDRRRSDPIRSDRRYALIWLK